MRLEQNKCLFVVLSLKTNIKHTSEKRTKNVFFPISKKNSFSKSAYSKNFAEKSDIFRMFFKNRKLLPKTRRMSPVKILYDEMSSLWQYLKIGIFWRGEGEGSF